MDNLTRQIAGFAADLEYDQLPPEVVATATRFLVESLACAIAAHDCESARMGLPLARVRDEFAIPMIYITHNLTAVLTLADWVLMIREGCLIAQGVPQRDAHVRSSGQGNRRRATEKRFYGHLHRVG